MKIAVFGMLPFSQLIREGFEKLEHKISTEDPDLIFSNDPTGYHQSLILKKKYPNAYLLFNFLDIPWHHPNIHLKVKILVKNFLTKADAVTVISFKVKKDLAQFFDKKMHVIYNPVKDVYYDKKINKDNMFLFVGRAKEPIKRIHLVHDSLLKIKNGIKNVKICGAENPGFGKYLGYVSDEELNKLYNSTKYVFLPSKAEGIGLPMIEAMICGSLPITCSDNETAKEFLPPDFICEPNPQAIVDKIEELDKEYTTKRELAFEFGKKYRDKFNKISIAKNILSIKK